jgi:hypothetical protein
VRHGQTLSRLKNNEDNEDCDNINDNENNKDDNNHHDNGDDRLLGSERSVPTRREGISARA